MDIKLSLDLTMNMLPAAKEMVAGGFVIRKY